MATPAAMIARSGIVVTRVVAIWTYEGDSPSKIAVFVTASSIAAAIDPTASVATKDGIRTYATAIPLARPATAPAPSAIATAAPVPRSWKAIADTPAAPASPATKPIDRSNSPMTRMAVMPTASTHWTDESSRTARALSSVRNVFGRAAEKNANAATKATTRLQRSAIARGVIRPRRGSGNFAPAPRPSAAALTLPRRARRGPNLAAPGALRRSLRRKDVELGPLRSERRQHLGGGIRISPARIRAVHDLLFVGVSLGRPLCNRIVLREVCGQLVNRDDSALLVLAHLEHGLSALRPRDRGRNPVERVHLDALAGRTDRRNRTRRREIAAAPDRVDAGVRANHVADRPLHVRHAVLDVGVVARNDLPACVRRGRLHQVARHLRVEELREVDRADLRSPWQIAFHPSQEEVE